jgi:hypothetical protein
MSPKARLQLNELVARVRARPLEFTLLMIAAAAVIVTMVATAAVALNARSPRDLTFTDASDELSRMLAAGGADRVGRLDRAPLARGSEPVFADTIRVSADSLIEPSFAKGGFVSDQVSLYNDHAVRQAIIESSMKNRAGRTLSEGPSFFRSLWTENGTRRLSERPDPSALAIRSPYAEGGWREVRTADWSRNPGLIGYDGEVALRPDTGAAQFHARINGRQCDVKREPPRQLMYCRSVLASDASVFYDFGFELYAGPNGGVFSTAFPYRQREIWMNGRARTFGRQTVKGGDVFDVQWIGPFMLSAADWGTLAAEQWINGRPTFANEPLGTLSFFSRAGRAAPFLLGTTPLVLGFDATFARDLEREARRFLTANERLLARMSVVVLDVRTGEIKAIVEPARESNNEPLLSFEPLLVGSVVKPIIAAAILSRQPSLADLRLSYAGDTVHSIDGIPLMTAFGNGANGCSGNIDFSAFLRCSSNQFAAELLIRSLEHDGFVSKNRPGTIVPRRVLEASSVATGLAEAFDVDAFAGRNRGRLSLYWNAAGATTPDAVAMTTDRSLVPWESRPWIIFPDSAGTRVDWLARYAFGGWENRWTLLGLAQSFARIATDRNVQATFMHSSLATQPGSRFRPVSPATANAFARVRGALRQVPDAGTAAGLTARLRAVTKEPVAVLAKTGTLNEDVGKLKSLAVVIGKSSRNDADAPIACGLVAVSYFEFLDTWAARRERVALPRVHLDFASGPFADVLGRHWTRLSGCATPPPAPAPRKPALSTIAIR